ncbi:MAG: hypothetical protein WAW96_16005 [Alphaproteobacteria bacterium]
MLSFVMGLLKGFLGARRCFGLRLARLAICVAASAFVPSLPALAAEAPAASSAADVSGYWHIEGRLAGNAIRLLCHFGRAGADFGGLCFGDGTPAAGNFDNGRAVWRWKVGSHVLTFDAMLDADGTLKGKVSTVAFAGIPVAGNFSAARPAPESEREPALGQTALKLIIGDLARGELPTESCTGEFADGLRKQMAALQAAYSQLGVVKSMSFIDTIHGSSKVTTEIYEVHFPQTKRICSIDITKAGKLSDLICAEE